MIEPLNVIVGDQPPREPKELDAYYDRDAKRLLVFRDGEWRKSPADYAPLSMWQFYSDGIATHIISTNAPIKTEGVAADETAIRSEDVRLSLCPPNEHVARLIVRAHNKEIWRSCNPYEEAEIRRWYNKTARALPEGCE